MPLSVLLIRILASVTGLLHSLELELELSPLLLDALEPPIKPRPSPLVVADEEAGVVDWRGTRAGETGDATGAAVAKAATKARRVAVRVVVCMVWRYEYYATGLKTGSRQYCVGVGRRDR